jgi:hypothetical protein
MFKFKGNKCDVRMYLVLTSDVLKRLVLISDVLKGLRGCV